MKEINLAWVQQTGPASANNSGLTQRTEDWTSPPCCCLCVFVWVSYTCSDLLSWFQPSRTTRQSAGTGMWHRLWDLSPLKPPFSSSGDSMCSSLPLPESCTPQVDTAHTCEKGSKEVPSWDDQNGVFWPTIKVSRFLSNTSEASLNRLIKNVLSFF